MNSYASYLTALATSIKECLHNNVWSMYQNNPDFPAKEYQIQQPKKASNIIIIPITTYFCGPIGQFLQKQYD